ncbi:tRNA 2-thiouridine(34) synthase MnmA [Pseudodesulfovibrio sp.]|uniref:tRNA 2-thiouridine(34) synthase MnmA n=1 Tax=Pseudodesulfovibrio sp. TaxID=2035812 RepID=UPI002631B416|nr:tRNA 2-thiouridine(34) synthase MnmA [Pseudodesulfovibrio sp.]MDD3313726.1 tRNA 2-thiouridine(34) synthase MnmA [Pseudodesulfovibrio sp.]
MTVAVAVSGGMDSLLALALLRERGLGLVAVHGRFLPSPEGGEDAVAKLAGTCAAMGVPFHAPDLRGAFEDRVVSPFVEGYRHGLTPNPCALCNPRMKFGALFDFARSLGADGLATGHYVRMEERPGLGLALVRGADRAKDQSYFLSLVPVELLRAAQFPLGDVRKRDVPALLAARGLTPPLPTESQEICFVPNDDYHAFLQGRGLMPGPGPIVLEDGRVIGRHRGLWRHTEGQRRGLGVAWTEPLYVLDKDMAVNALVVGPKSSLEAAGCVAGEANVMVPPEAWPEAVLVQTRYRQQARPARVRLDGDRLVCRFLSPQGRPTPGQVLAVYTEDGAVLAGGVIEGPLGA